jgi:hypothetical protein
MNYQPYDNSIKGIFKEDAQDLIPNFLEGTRLSDIFDIEVLRPPICADTHQRSANCRVFNRGAEVGLRGFSQKSSGIASSLLTFYNVSITRRKETV